MKETAQQIRELIKDFYQKYKDLDDSLASQKPMAESWSLKEIIGHLIDSASNNHQRFVRLQKTSLLDFPSYHYSWIDIEGFNQMPFADLILLWRQYNLLLAHIIETVDPEALPNLWAVEDEVFPLEFIMSDYLRHLKEHIEHFEKRLKEVQH